jgi:thiol:disulfide interchange protein
MAAVILALLALVGGYTYALEVKLKWRNPTAAGASSTVAVEAGGVPWQKWSPDAVAKARAEGHPVLVDFTADWCLTCQWNKESSIEIEAVKKKLAEVNAVAFLADFTLRDRAIGQEIRRFNRAGVPLVVVYPADPNASAIVLPELLTPGIVLRALDLAGKKNALSSNSASRPVERVRP